MPRGMAPRKERGAFWERRDQASPAQVRGQRGARCYRQAGQFAFLMNSYSHLVEKRLALPSHSSSGMSALSTCTATALIPATITSWRTSLFPARPL